MAQENDIVLIHFEDKPLMFGRIETIWADAKPDWYHVKLLLLQLPPQPVKWILRNEYINGEEFTMNGKRMRMELVVCPKDPDAEDDIDGTEDAEPDAGTEDGKKGASKVISFADLKKR